MDCSAEIAVLSRNRLRIVCQPNYEYQLVIYTKLSSPKRYPIQKAQPLLSTLPLIVGTQSSHKIVDLASAYSTRNTQLEILTYGNPLSRIPHNPHIVCTTHQQ